MRRIIYLISVLLLSFIHGLSFAQSRPSFDKIYKGAALSKVTEGFILDSSIRNSDLFFKSYGIEIISISMPVQITSENHEIKVDSQRVDFIIGLSKKSRDEWVRKFSEMGIITTRLDTASNYRFYKNVQLIPYSLTPDPIVVHHSPIISVEQFNHESETMKTDAVNYLSRYYKSKNGEVSISRYGQGFKIIVEKLRREVIYDHNYWEQLIILLDIDLVRDNQSQIVLIFEGYFQARTGNAPSYDQSMEKKEFKKLFDYSQKIRNQLNEYINEKKNHR